MTREPVALGGVVKLIVMLAAGFGLDLTTEQLLAVYALIETIITFIQRRAVSPVASRAEHVTPPV